MANGNKANKYGGKDSWDDYDNTNMMTPSQQATSTANRASIIMDRPSPGRNMHSNMERRLGVVKQLRDQVKDLQDPEGRQ